MKKLMIAAAAMVAGVAIADVTSANIVGYNMVTIDRQWKIFAVNFEAVGGGSLTIQDAMPYQDGMTMGSGTSNADQIQVQKEGADGYDIFFLSNGTFFRPGQGQVTYPEKVGKWFAAGAGWSSEPTTAVMPVGKGAWYGSKTNETITITIDSPIK